MKRKTKKRPWRSATNRSIKVRHTRCKRVLVIFNNQVEIVDLLREETHFPPPHQDFDYEPVELAVVRFIGVEVYVPRGSVVFLLEEQQSKSKGNLKPPFRARAKERAMIHQLINDLANAETGLRALGDRKSAELANRIHEYLPRLFKLGGVVLTPAGRKQFRAAPVQRMMDTAVAEPEKRGKSIGDS